MLESQFRPSQGSYVLEARCCICGHTQPPFQYTVQATWQTGLCSARHMQSMVIGAELHVMQSCAGAQNAQVPSKSCNLVSCSFRHQCGPGNNNVVKTAPALTTHLPAQFPAGLIDAGETAAQAALRELKEETGYSGAVLEVSPVCYSDPGMSNANMQFAVVAVDAGAPENRDVVPELEARPCPRV